MVKKKDIETLEKYITLTIDWISAEYNYLEKFKSELEEIKNDPPKKIKKDFKKAVSFIRYIGRAERRANRYEKKVSKELQEINEELHPHIKDEMGLNMIGGLSDFKNMIEDLKINGAQVVKYSSLYHGKLNEQLTKAQIEEELYEKIKTDHPKKAEQIHKHFLNMLSGLTKEIDFVEEWIASFQVSLKETEQFINKLTNNDKINILDEGLAILKKYRFPIAEHPQFAKFLSKYPLDLKKMALAAGNHAEHLFKYCLLIVQDTIEKKVVPWNKIVDGIPKIVISVDLGNIQDTKNFLSLTNHLLNNKLASWDQIVDGVPKLFSVEIKDTVSFFYFTLYPIEDLLKEGTITWNQVVNSLPKLYLATDDKEFIKNGLFAVKDLFKEKVISWDQIVDGLFKLIHAASDSKYFFSNNFNDFKSLLKDKLISWDQLVDGYPKLINGNFDNILAFYERSVFFVAKDLLKKKAISWDQIVDGLPKLSVVGKKKIHFLGTFFTGVQELLEEKVITWDQAIDGSIKLAPFVDDNEYGFFKGLNLFIDLLKEKTISWDQIIENFYKISGVVDDWYDFKEDVLPIIRFLLEEQHVSFNKVADDISKIIRLPKNNVYRLFNMCKPEIEDIVNKENWGDFAGFFFYIAKSKQKTERMIDLFSKLNSMTKPFLIYLVQTKPKLVLNILERYNLLEILEINFQQQLTLFLKIASPITLKDKNFSGLTTISLPFKDLDSSTRSKFLKFLNISVSTFQGVNVNFLKSLQATEGFEDTNQYSFIDLVYIYLKYSRDPNLKLKKLNKSIIKLQKEEKKCLNAVANKKNLKELNDVEIKKLQATLKSIGEMFFELVLTLYTTSSEESLSNHLETIFRVKIKNLNEKLANGSFYNALQLMNKLEPQKYSHYRFCFNIIKNYLIDNTYPLTKNLLKGYPWNLPENQAWCKKHLKNKWWYEDFRKEYRTRTEDVIKSNVEERIKHHFEQSQRIIVQLGLETKKLTLENVEETYKGLAKNKDKYNSALLSDLKTQVVTLKSLKGQKQAELKSGKKIIIQPEFDPLEIFQMGNYVQGSCLAINGVNPWSAVTNALDVNKRVLWAKDSQGNILARLLIAVDESNKLVRFPIYYSTHLNLNTFFDNYIKELAEKCGFEINGSGYDVKEILDVGWYRDPDINI
ncbi:hypothetical protein HOA91_02005 [Candidatus Woesearchaeota archaeon]|jgi:hypothetical protein|nr:hypothetical protein [Candidatus Woesearchaeota archaeon]